MPCSHIFPMFTHIFTNFKSDRYQPKRRSATSATASNNKQQGTGAAVDKRTKCTIDGDVKKVTRKQQQQKSTTK